MTYKYLREDGTEFYVDHKITDDALEKCPVTGQACRRVPLTGKDANGAFSIKGFSYKNGYSK